MNNANRTILRMLGILFVSLFHTSLSYAGDFKDAADKDLFMPVTVLTVPAKTPSEWIPFSGQSLYRGNNNFFLVHFPAISSQQSSKKGFSHNIGKAMDLASDFFFTYFSVHDYSVDDSGAESLLKNKIRTFKDEPRNFQLNLGFDIGYHTADNLSIDAIRVESFFHHTFVTTIYHYGKKEIELGLSNVMINNLLLDGMRLEIQTNPYANSGAVLLTMTM